MRVVIFADTPDEARDGLLQHLDYRATNLRNSCARNATDKKANDRAARELELEAEWLRKIEFEPRANAPLWGTSGKKADMAVTINEGKV